jgi:23S rRNA (cytidine1920-2'-O)/16S rRNA (cytidine1409-2'-O)-methyltransferase
VNARYLQPEDFGQLFALVVMDVSFISATKVLPAIVPLMSERGRLIVLIKPQFEVGRGEVGSGGIVREPEKHRRVVKEVNEAAAELGLELRGVMESPIQGADGNVEFLACYEKPSG